jgi:DNA-binding transcriptional LysR family regulator
MDKLASLRAFVRVVELSSFSEAGKRLRLSRSAISKHVGDLEELLGVQLLSRTTRRVTPTEIGQAYFDRDAAEGAT